MWKNIRCDYKWTIIGTYSILIGKNTWHERWDYFIKIKLGFSKTKCTEVSTYTKETWKLQTWNKSWIVVGVHDIYTIIPILYKYSVNNMGDWLCVSRSYLYEAFRRLGGDMEDRSRFVSPKLSNTAQHYPLAVCLDLPIPKCNRLNTQIINNWHEIFSDPNAVSSWNAYKSILWFFFFQLAGYTTYMRIVQ